MGDAGGVIPPKGMQGTLRQAIPYDGCSELGNPVDPYSSDPQFTLILRGYCQFDVKVMNAQLAGYSAAIIYDDQDEKELITSKGRASVQTP
jgi:E3 ubiquitin-protein ligase RNF13